MDKRRKPQTTFRWQKDAAGYDLSPDRQFIVRRGGAMTDYDPAAMASDVHRQFANLLLAVGRTRTEIRGGNARTFSTGYEDRETALLAFVSKYGFLGSDRSGADTEREEIEYLIRAQVMLSILQHSGAERSPASFAEMARDLLGSLLVNGALPGPTLRMYFGPDEHSRRMQVHYEPESLYAWMWLRVAEELSEGIHWDGTPCLFCFAALGRGPGGHRADAKFCDDKCRVSFWRLGPKKRAEHTAQARAKQRNRREAIT